MVRRRGSICSVPGCPNWVASPGRCPTCGRSNTQRRATRQERGYTDTWLEQVKQAIAAQPWCTRCRATEDLTGDHVVPLNRGGTADDIQVLCRSCNSRKQDIPDEHANF